MKNELLLKAQGLLKESRKIIRASGSRQLAKDWDIRTTKLLADIESELFKSNENPKVN